jgi:short subunit dehydrogenase-like uncharacterized protein
MGKSKILIYGAGGYVGQLFINALANTHYTIVLGARKAFKTTLPLEVFSLEDSSEIIRKLTDCKLVINLAGPFKHTSLPLIKACIATHTHYIDIAGEAPEFEAVHAYHQKAIEAGIMLMPGAGFGVVPTDLVANLAHAKLPDANQLRIGYITNGGASRGTLKTVLADINKEGVVLKNGQYHAAKPANSTFNVEIAGKNQELVYNPWRADLFTAHSSTGIPNIETYANFPGFIVSMMQGRLLWLRDFMLSIANFLPVGPSAKELQKGNTISYAQVQNAQGQTAQAYIYGPEAYVFTVETLKAITQQVMNDHLKPGFQTPNIYGIDLIKNIQNVSIEA